MRTFSKGGIHPNENKLNSDKSIEYFSIPKQAVLLVTQHLGAPSTLIVQKGDKVKVGQLIAKADAFICSNLHSSVSGTVSKVDIVMDANGYKKPAVYIDVEGDEWVETIDRSETVKREITLTKEEIIAKIKEMGIVGLGGACFPTHIKYMLSPDKKADYLIINAAECEPYITIDERIMIERGEQCIIGISIMMKALGVQTAKVGIERNKKKAIEMMTEIAAKYNGIEIVPMKTKYPQGAEKQLIKTLLNREVPNGGLPIEVGCVVNNIHTAYAIYEAVQKNKPLIENTTTVTGKNLGTLKNYRIRIGTPLSEIIASVGGLPEHTGKLIAGGPMMGKAVSNPNCYTVKGMSSFLFMDEKEAKRGEVSSCLKCGKCVSVCPMGLEPYLLQQYSALNRYDETEKLAIMNCIECGSCAYGCPSNRPLLDYIRIGKQKTMQIIRSRKSN